MELLIEIKETFKNYIKPKIIYEQKYIKNNKIDFERKSIQDQFGIKSLEDFTAYDCLMMIIDHTMINDEAYIYFLPKLTKYVFLDDNHIDMFVSRLKLIDKKKLNSSQVNLLEKIINESLKVGSNNEKAH